MTDFRLFSSYDLARARQVALRKGFVFTAEEMGEELVRRKGHLRVIVGDAPRSQNAEPLSPTQG